MRMEPFCGRFASHLQATFAESSPSLITSPGLHQHTSESSHFTPFTRMCPWPTIWRAEFAVDGETEPVYDIIPQNGVRRIEATARRCCQLRLGGEAVVAAELVFQHAVEPLDALPRGRMPYSRSYRGVRVHTRRQCFLVDGALPAEAAVAP